MTIDRICTIGPASNNKETLAQLIKNGMKIVRLNLSHGTHESHKDIIRLVKSLDDSIKFLGDVQGPKIRLGEVKESKLHFRQEILLFYIQNQLQGVIQKQVLIMKELRMM
ncbi:pyruvate kinase [Bacillus sp. CB102A.1]